MPTRLAFLIVCCMTVGFANAVIAFMYDEDLSITLTHAGFT